MAAPLPVVVHSVKTRTVNGSTRYSEELLEALQAIGVDARAHHPFYRELRIGRRRVGGLVSLALGTKVPVIRRKAVVHATQYYDNPPLVAADVVTVHDVMPVSHPDLYGLTPARHRWHRRTVARALRKGQVVTPTRHSRSEILRLFPEADPDRVHAIPNGVDHSCFFPEPGPHPALRAGMLNVALVMNRERRKRVDLLLEAAAGLPFVNVVHVGNLRPDRAHRGAATAADSWAQRLRAQGRYHATGQAGDDALRRVLSSCDVVVHPSLAEGFGLPPLEALACGARVLASGIPPHREVLGDAARYVDVSAGALAKALEAAWDGEAVRDGAFPPRAKRLAQARRYTWEATARGTLEVYRRVPGKTA